jgi:hypothetical protein
MKNAYFGIVFINGHASRERGSALIAFLREGVAHGVPVRYNRGFA